MKLLLDNPKRETSPGRRKDLYDFYAGYSAAFVKSVLDRVFGKQFGTVLDPWNGAGTTTEISAGLGHDAIGFDLNPAMVVIAKAKVLRITPARVVEIAHEIVRARQEEPEVSAEDPLLTWFVPRSVACIRAIENSMIRQLCPKKASVQFSTAQGLSSIEPTLAFFYTALFKTARSFLQNFRSTNPTWLKQPDSPYKRVRPDRNKIEQHYMQAVEEMCFLLGTHDEDTKSKSPTIAVASSLALPLKNDSIASVITSPPYCTRIDYAMAMRLELAVLRMDATTFDELRRRLIGSPVILGPELGPIKEEWGPTAGNLLSAIKAHPSKASCSYYLKTYLQYFDMIYKSLAELDRVLMPGASIALVVQDSHYKELHVDLARIFIEMGNSFGWSLEQQSNFGCRRIIAEINSKARRYRGTMSAVESTLLFQVS